MSQEILDDFAMCNIEKAISDTIDLNTVLMILHQETPKEISFCESMDIMKFVMAANCYPNILVAYRILLTVPMTIASA